MAYLPADDKLLQDQNGQGAQGAQVGSSGSPIVSGASSNDVANNTSTAGIGAGGTGGWTNIQAYLNANKGDQGAANLVNEKIGGQFNQEKSGLESEASKQKAAASDQLKPLNDVKSNAQNLLDQGAGAYDYSGKSNGDAYTKALSSFQGALGGQYQGPKKFNYALGDKTQQYGSALGSDESFNQYLGDLYQDKAGGQLSSGGRELQKQLNISNEPLKDARENLLKQYSGLNDYRDQTVNNTDAALGQAASDYASGQNYLKDFLSNNASSYESALGKAQSDAKSAYQKDFNTGHSGRAGYGANYTGKIGGAAPVDYGGFKDSLGRLGNEGLLGKDLTWSQLQREQQIGDILSGKFGAITDPMDQTRSVDKNLLKNNLAALNNYYGQQTSKYASTGDNEKRHFNLIQDILKSDAERKKAGFDVRKA